MITTFKIFEEAEESKKFYWSVSKDKYLFFAGLKKIGCPIDRIKKMHEEISADVRKPTANRVFVGLNKNIGASSRKWSYDLYTTPTESHANFFHRFGYEYMGPIKFTREELQQIELEKITDKYNL